MPAEQVSPPLTAATLDESVKEEIQEMAEKGLNHVPEPTVKNVLPSAGDIAQEKVLQDILTVDKRTSLNKVDTVEKIVLPTPQDIQQEKNESSAL